MKFLHLINVRWYNATAWYAINLAKITNNMGHRVIVAGLPGSPPIKKAQEYGIETFEADFNTNRFFRVRDTIRSVNSLLEQFKPDVINCHRGEFFWYFAIKRYLNKVSNNNDWKLIRFRGDQRKAKGNFINRFLYNKASDMVIASGVIIRNQLIDDLKCRNVEVIYGGVDRDIFKFNFEGRKRVRNEFGFNDGNFVVGVVGRFDHVKGHIILIKAISHIYNVIGNKNIRLMIVGFDANITSDQIKEMTIEHGIGDIAFITGHRKDIVDVMSSLDLAVVPSIGSETICRVAMELMSVGVPVVASNVGVLPEVVPSENIYNNNNYLELSDKIISHSKKLIIFDEIKFYRDYMDLVEGIL